MSKFKVGDKVVYVVYGLDNFFLETVIEVDDDEKVVRVSGSEPDVWESEDDFVLYEGSKYQWRQEGERMYADAQERIRQLEDQLAAAREALEWYADWASNYQNGGKDRFGNSVPEVLFDGGSKAREALNNIQRVEDDRNGRP